MGATVMLSAVLVLASSALTGSAPAASGKAPNCADVASWYFDIPGAASYYLVKTGSGWVASYQGDGSNPFATLSLSVSGSAFHAHSVYNGANTGYTATADGTLSQECSVGVTSHVGHWNSNHDPKGGYFTMTPELRLLPGKAIIEGYTKNEQGTPVAGVIVRATGATNADATSGADGHYMLTVQAGRYDVTPSGPLGATKATFSPGSTTRSVAADAVAEADFLVQQEDHLAIKLVPASVASDGLGTVAVTITDTDQQGQSVSGATIVVEPPVEVGTDGVANAILCDSATDQLRSPKRLNDGTLLGEHFTAKTNGAGQVQLTLFVGTLSGDWTLDAYQPGKPGAPLVTQSVTVEPAGARPHGDELDPDDTLVGNLISQGSPTLTQSSQSLQRNLLEWLAAIQPELRSANIHIGYAPIYAVDAAGQTNGGVVLFADSTAARKAVLRYLDGTGAPPPDTEAGVIDVPNMLKMLQVGEATGNAIHHISYRLPSLEEWADGTRIQISSNETTVTGQSAVIPIPARGRPHLGLTDAKGNESLLYGYGPYLPSPFSFPVQEKELQDCVTS